jgi:hypothetical protein
MRLVGLLKSPRRKTAAAPAVIANRQRPLADIDPA